MKPFLPQKETFIGPKSEVGHSFGTDEISVRGLERSFAEGQRDPLETLAVGGFLGIFIRKDVGQCSFLVY